MRCGVQALLPCALFINSTSEYQSQITGSTGSAEWRAANTFDRRRMI